MEFTYLDHFDIYSKVGCYMEIMDQQSFDYLSFKDYLSNKENQNHDFTTVFRMDPVANNDSLYLFSALVKKDAVDQITNNATSEIELEYSLPTFLKSTNNNIIYNSGKSYSNNILFERLSFCNKI